MSGETQEVDSKPVVTSKADTRGRYLYCVAENSQEMDLGSIGINGNNVYTIPYQDISAVVHNCPAQPYESKDNALRISSKPGGKLVCRRDCMLHSLVVRRFAPNDRRMESAAHCRGCEASSTIRW